MMSLNTAGKQVTTTKTATLKAIYFIILSYKENKVHTLPASDKN